MVQAATEFRKSGFTDEESATLARVASMYQNVADESISAGESASFIIAQMKAFNIEAEDSQHIIDAINEVSNNFAVSSSDLAGTLGIVSANMANVGNSYEQTLGMMTAITEVTRNSSKAARGLNSITSRLIQTLDAESSTGKKLKAIYEELGIALFDQEGQLRNSFDIFKDLSQVWGSLSTNQREYIALTSAGANQVQNFTALMSNFDQAVRATETAINSQGSALHENERVMESLEAKTNLLKATFQDLANNVITNDMVKAVLDLGQKLLQFLNGPVGITIIRFGLVTGTLTGFLTIAGTVGGKIIGLTKALFGLGSAATAAGAGAKVIGAGFLSAHPVILAVAAAIGVAAAAYGAWMDAEKKEAQAQEIRLQNNNDLLKNVKNRLVELESVPTSDRTDEWQKEYDHLLEVNKELKERIKLINQANDTSLNPVTPDDKGYNDRRNKANLIHYKPTVSYSSDLTDTWYSRFERGSKYVHSKYAKEVKELAYNFEILSESVKNGEITYAEFVHYLKENSLVAKAKIEFSDDATLDEIIQTIKNKLGNGVIDISYETVEISASDLIGTIDTLSSKFNNLNGTVKQNGQEVQVEAEQLNNAWVQLQTYADGLIEAQKAGATLHEEEQKAIAYVRDHQSIMGLLGSSMYDTNDTLTKLTKGLSVSNLELSGLLTTYPQFNNYLDTSTGKIELSGQKLLDAAIAGDDFAESLIKTQLAINQLKLENLTKIYDKIGTVFENATTDNIFLAKINDGLRNGLRNGMQSNLTSLKKDVEYYEGLLKSLKASRTGNNFNSTNNNFNSTKTKSTKDPIQTQYNAYKKLLDAQKERIALRKKEGASDQELIELWKELSQQAEGYGDALQKQFGLTADNEYLTKLKSSVIDFSEEARSIEKSILDTTLNELTGRISWYETNGWAEGDSAVKRWEAHVNELTKAYEQGILTKKEYDERLLTANDSLLSARTKAFKDRLALGDSYISDRNNWGDWDKWFDPRDGSVDSPVKAYERLIALINQQYSDGLITAKDYYEQLEKYSLELRNARRDELDSLVNETEEYISERNSLNDWGTDSELKQYNQLMAEIKKLIDKGNVDFEYGMKVRNQIAQKANEAMLKNFEDTIDKITSKYESLVEDAQKASEDYKGDIQDLVDIAQNRLDTIQDQLDAIDDKWDAELEALEKSNNELDKQIQKEEALNDLAKARSKKVLVYKDGRFQYINDADEISSAQKKLDELERKEQLEAQKEAIEEKRKAEKADLEDEKAHLEKYIKYWDDFLKQYEIDTKKANVISKNLWDGQSKNWKQGLTDLQSFIDEYKKKMADYNKAVESQKKWETEILPNLNDPDKLTSKEVQDAIKDINDPQMKNEYWNKVIEAAQTKFQTAKTEDERVAANQQANAARAELGIAPSVYEKNWNNVIAEAKDEFAKATTEAERIAANQKANEAREHLGLPQEVYGGSSNSTKTTSSSSSRGTSTSSGNKVATTVAGIMGTVLPKTVTTTIGAVGTMVGTALSKVFGSVTKNANGTYGAVGGMSLLGEHGPELRVLSRGDGVIPAGATKNLFEWGKTTPKEFMAGITSKNDMLSQLMSINIQNLNLPSVQNGEDFVTYMKDNFWRTTVQQMSTNY